MHATGSHILQPALEFQEGTDLADVSLSYWNRDKPFLDLQQDRSAGLREPRTLGGGMWGLQQLPGLATPSREDKREKIFLNADLKNAHC